MIVGIIFAALFFGAAIFISIHKLLEIRKIASMQGWTKISGKVLSNDSSRETDGDGGSNLMQTLTYSYTIKTQDYTGVITWCADNHPGNEKFMRHAPGQRVDVLYNPVNTSESVLGKFDQKKVFNSMWFAGFFLVMGIVFLLFDFYEVL